jgi:hypothetical protein
LHVEDNLEGCRKDIADKCGGTGLNTKGYATDTYSLNFTAGSDPAIHSVPFAVR